VSVSEARAVPLPQLGSGDFTAEAGGRKAMPLHELTLAGFPVPPGFVVPPEIELDGCGRQIEAAVARIGGYPVAARSSGHLEDLEGASFAGQYVTRLAIHDTSELLQGIAECRASARSPQVLAYLHKNGLDEAQARVSVLVQAMVDPAVAGVAFTIHPTTGREEHALIECCRGLGEKLVSGHTSPTRYVVRLEDAAVVEREPGEEDVELEANAIGELRDYMLELQAHFGRPQDIEWALDRNGRLRILQSRPVTRIQWRRDIGEFTTADFREGGVSARVCTPLMYSLYRDAVQASMQRYFIGIRLLPKSAAQCTWIDIFYGRPYWSASAVKDALRKVPGFDEEVFDRDLGIQKIYPESGPARTPVSFRTLLPAIPVALALERNYRRHLRSTSSYGERFLPQEAAYLKAADSFGAQSDPEFFAAFREVLNLQFRTECDYFTTIYNNANFQSDLKKLLSKIAAATGEPVSAVALMSGLQDIGHMKVQRDVAGLVAAARSEGTASAAFERALADFLAENYFHGDAELDLSVPRWGERPDRVKQIVEDILRSASGLKDPESSQRAQAAQYSSERQRILAAVRRSPWHRLRFERAFERRLRLARAYLSRREQMREYSTRAYNLVRRYAIEAGLRLHRKGLLRNPEEVFMLHAGELAAAGRGEESAERILSSAKFRKLMYRGYRMLDPPGELGRAISQRLQGSTDGAVLSGIGCSSGIVRAAARVVPTLEEAHSLRQGEILVTRFTDPGWTPVLGLVAGIVAEVGGLLSHAAVIGREYGIPAVLNVPDATRLLKTGQWIEIDGSAGTVRILERENLA
jgi:phosphohistidine swiveling domain-containing protein